MVRIIHGEARAGWGFGYRAEVGHILSACVGQGVISGQITNGGHCAGIKGGQVGKEGQGGQVVKEGQGGQISVSAVLVVVIEDVAADGVFFAAVVVGVVF